MVPSPLKSFASPNSPWHMLAVSTERSVEEDNGMETILRKHFRSSGFCSVHNRVTTEAVVNLLQPLDVYVNVFSDDVVAV